MFDAKPGLPDLSLLVAPGDTAELLGACTHTDPAGRAARCLIYVAVHRRAEAWTHVYRVVQDRRPGHLTVFMAKALPGERVAEAADWARAQFAL